MGNHFKCAIDKDATFISCTMIIVSDPFSVEILVEPSVYFAQELDEAIQVSKKDGIMI